MTHFFQGYGRESSCSEPIICQGTLWNQSETMKTSKAPSGASITAKMGQNCKKGVFKGDCSLDALFSRLWEGLQVFWTPDISEYRMVPIRDNEDLKRLK